MVEHQVTKENMSNLNANTLRIYGGNPPGDIVAQQVASPTNQSVTEVLIPGTYRRLYAAPKRGGRSSIQTFVDSAGGALSTLNIFFSNLPNPSVASDADWTLSAITALDLTSTVSKFTNIVDVFPEWFMLKATILVSNASIRVFVRTEGTSV